MREASARGDDDDGESSLSARPTLRLIIIDRGEPTPAAYDA